MQLGLFCNVCLYVIFLKTLNQIPKWKGGMHLENKLYKRSRFIVADLQQALLSFISNDAKWELRRCSSCCILSAWKSFAFSSRDQKKLLFLTNRFIKEQRKMFKKHSCPEIGPNLNLLMHAKFIQYRLFHAYRLLKILILEYSIDGPWRYFDFQLEICVERRLIIKCWDVF